MIEAMACGTPAIARPRGSTPEIIEHGVSGFLVESDADAADAISQLSALDRRRVRDAFERRFTVHRMAEQYLTIYGRLAAGSMHPRLSKLTTFPRPLGDRRLGVTARRIAQPPRRLLSRGFNLAGCPAKSLVSYQINRQLSGWNFPH